MSVIDSVVGVALLASTFALPPDRPIVDTTESVVIDSALVVRGLDNVIAVTTISDVVYYCNDFIEFAYNGYDSFNFGPNQAFIICNIYNPYNSEEQSNYFIDLYNVNIDSGLLLFSDNDAELVIDSTPQPFICFRSSTLLDIFSDFVGVEYTEATTTDIINSYRGIYSNSIVVSHSYWYDLGFEDGYEYYLNNVATEADFSFLDIFNKLFTLELFPGFKIYYLLVFALGIIALRGVAKAVL